MSTGIDLHTHSTASDGTDTPAELVAAAARAGLQVVALTDHDTHAGIPAAAAALPPGLTLVPGVEISCFSVEPGGARVTLHLLGYLADPQHPGLSTALESLVRSRLHRGRAIVERLAADGVAVSWKQVEGLAAGGTVGRPHVARALVEVGHCSSVPQAFDDVLHRDGPYHVPKQDLPVLEAVALVAAAGGVSVFAHPDAHRRGPVVSDATITSMAQAGLGGLEVDHVDHDDDSRRRLGALAADLNVLSTGSSDYHGSLKAVRLGASTTRPEVLEQLLARATGARPLTASNAA